MCQQQRRKDQAVVVLLRVKDPFNVVRPSPYRCIRLTSKVRFINKNEIRNYILGLLHAVTCLVLDKRDDKQNLQIECLEKRPREIDKLSLQFTNQTLIHSLCEKITNGFFVSVPISVKKQRQSMPGRARGRRLTALPVHPDSYEALSVPSHLIRN